MTCINKNKRDEARDQIKKSIKFKGRVCDLTYLDTLVAVP